MKKIILSGSILLTVLFATKWVSADCFYQETAPECSISGQTYTSSCAGWSDTSSWSIPVAYQWTCTATPSLTQTEQTVVASILYKYLDNKDYITSETEANYTLSSEWKKYLQDSLFPAIQSLIAKEILKTDPNHKKIAIFNHLVTLVGYDYYMKK